MVKHLVRYETMQCIWINKHQATQCIEIQEIFLSKVALYINRHMQRGKNKIRDHSIRQHNEIFRYKIHRTPRQDHELKIQDPEYPATCQEVNIRDTQDPTAKWLSKWSAESCDNVKFKIQDPQDPSIASRLGSKIFRSPKIKKHDPQDPTVKQITRSKLLNIYFHYQWQHALEQKLLTSPWIKKGEEFKLQLLIPTFVVKE